MSVLLEFSMFPTDVGESKSEYVSQTIKMVKESGVKYKLTPMSTVIETDTLPEALDIVNRAYECLEDKSNRVYSSLKIDIRQNRADALTQKIASIESKIGKVES